MATKINQSVYGTVPTNNYSRAVCPNNIGTLYSAGNYDPSGDCEGGFEKSISPWGIGGGMACDIFVGNAQRSANGRFAKLNIDTPENYNKPVSFWDTTIYEGSQDNNKPQRYRIGGNVKYSSGNFVSNGSTENGLVLWGANANTKPIGKIEYNHILLYPLTICLRGNENYSDPLYQWSPYNITAIEEDSSYITDDVELTAFSWGCKMYNSSSDAPNQWYGQDLSLINSKAQQVPEIYKAMSMRDSADTSKWYDKAILTLPNVIGAFDEVGRLIPNRNCSTGNSYCKLASADFTTSNQLDYTRDGFGKCYGVGNTNKHVFDDISYHYEVRCFYELNGVYREVKEGELILEQTMYFLPYFKIDETTYNTKWESMKAIIHHELAFIGFPFVMANNQTGNIGDNNVSVPIFDDHMITTGRFYTGAAGATLPNALWGDIFSDTMPEYDPDYIPPKPSPGEDESDRGELTNRTPTRRTTAGTIKYVCSFADINNLQNFLNGTYSPSEVQWIEDFKGANPADYIVSIQKYPFALPGQGDFEIVIGSVATSINAKSLFSSSLTINQSTIYDFGGIELTGELLYGDFRDYLCKLTLIMPFIGSIDLDPRMYMGHRVDLQYIIDFDTGSVAAEIKRDGLTMETKTSTISITIPFFAANMGQYQNALAQTQFAIEQSKIKQIAGIMSTSISIGGTLATGASGGALSDTATLGAAGGLVGGIASMLSGQVQQQQLQYELEHTAPQIGTVSVAAPANAFFLDDRARLIITRPCMIPGYNAEVYSHTVGNACAIPGTLSSFSGYTIASAAELSSITARDGSGVSPTAEELRMIKQSLQSGIYV